MSRLCALFGVSRPGYYARIKRGVSRRAEQDRVLLSQIDEISEKNKGRYGSPRVHDKLLDLGISCSRKRVERLMRQERLKAKAGRKFRSAWVTIFMNEPILWPPLNSLVN